ncbi:MAG: hypothetical protein K8S54_17810 [Spirochaetia bacterium]|nr:hypothetical protein [Spirochaetia bacterium]
MINSSTLTKSIYFVWFGSLSVVFFRGIDTMLMSLRWPLSISLDASILRFESWSWMQGQMPWTEILSLNLPLTHYIHMLGLVLFGVDDIGFRLLDVTWICVLAMSTYYTLRLFSIPAALTGVALTFTLIAEATPFGAFQRETLMLPFWLGALAASLKLSEPDLSTRNARIFWMLGAFSLFCACWIKPTSAVLVFLFLQPIWKASAGERTRGVAVFLGVGAVVSIGMLTPLIISGKLALAITSWWSLNVTYASWEARPMLPLIADLFTFRPDRWLLNINTPIKDVGDTGHLTLFHILLILSLLWFKRDRATVQVFLFLGAGLFSYAAQRRGFQYHVYPLWHGLNLVGAIVGGEIVRQLAGLADSSPAKRSRFEMAVLVLLFFALPTSWIMRQTYSYHAYVGTGLLNKRTNSRIPEFEIVGAVANKVEQLRSNNPARVIRYQVIEDASIALGAVSATELNTTSTRCDN